MDHDTAVQLAVLLRFFFLLIRGYTAVSYSSGAEYVSNTWIVVAAAERRWREPPFGGLPPLKGFAFFFFVVVVVVADGRTE